MKHISEFLLEALEMMEERAAIREFDGLQPRKEAERDEQIEVDAWKQRRIDDARQA